MALFDHFQDHYPLDRPRLLIRQIERAGKKPALPKYQTEDAAAMDIAAFLPEEGQVVLQPGEWKLIPTGLCMAIPSGFGGFLLARSGLAAKFAINLTNCRTKVNGETLTALIARKDALLVRLAAYRDLVYQAGQNTSRARGTEIRVKATLKAAELQKAVDTMAKEVRLLDNLLQETNWKTRLVE